MDERWRQGMFFYPFGAYINNIYDIKQEHDSYRVFVNGDYVGDKVLISEAEDVKDVERFLHDRGFTNISSQIEGNMYNIIVTDEEAAEEIKRNVDVYLKNR
ncbi:hypothetical protein [Thermobrachium celere]|uniref:hypothetical protein n=1 Tax=Thermobrachium celere TaxID=53422 RepID=UPI001945A707|nr:hypothetical protein [Thermobrachium celere]GFR35365.1 hypothetical protein TCEA9_11770 [Thermobrachium celere]